MHENFNEKESEIPPTDERIIEAINADFNSPRTRELYRRWYDAQEKEADRIGTDLARMECAVKRAVIYYKAGCIHEAVADLVETLDGVVNINEKGEAADGLQEKINDLLQKMRIGEAL